MVSTHTWVAVVEGALDPDRLLSALSWAVERHPMLRARLEPPSGERSDDTGPFVHAGRDGRWTWRPMDSSPDEVARNAFETVESIESSSSFDEAWLHNFEGQLDKATFDLTVGPLWRLRLLRGSGKDGDRNALVFCFVHALDDQKSANALLHDLLVHMAAAESGVPLTRPTPLPLPKSIEDVLLTEEMDAWRLAQYSLFQVENGAQPSVIIPSSLRSKERAPHKNWALVGQQPNAAERPLEVPTTPAEGNRKLLMPEEVDPSSDYAAENRRNLASVRKLPADKLALLRKMCRANNVTVSMAIAAATLLATSDVGHDSLDFGYEVYRLLLSVDMRRFAPGGADWTGGTISFASGALDFTTRILPGSATTYAAEFAEPSLVAPIGGVPFWELAQAAKYATEQWIEKGYVTESTRLFDMGTRMLRMDNVVYENAHDPNMLGRAYSVTVSNAGVYGHGEPDGKYGSLKLAGVYFGISQALTGSMVAASCLTQAGELHLTAVGATPFVSRSTIDSFADAIIRTLTIATEMRLPKRGLSVPRVDYPVNIRGSMPSFYPLETPKGALQCPAYEDVKSSRMPSFDADKYVGIWYELAFHDITQFNGCGCTQFNMTRRDLVIEDMFTVNCPWPWRSGVEGPWLPGFSKISGQRKLNLYTCNMTMYINPQRPGVMMETGFGQEFDNMVLEIWQDPEIQAETGYEFTRAIQFQCLGSPVDGQITFTGINFLSRVPIISPGMLQEMFVRARALGLEPFGANDMHKVEHEGCYYPKSTDRSWMGERPEWPSPVLDQELGALL